MYHKPDKYVVASDGKYVLEELLEQYERTLLRESENSHSPENLEKEE